MYFMTVDGKRSEHGSLYTRGQPAHCNCMYIYVRTIAWLLFHVEMSAWRGVQQATVQAQGWTVVERKQAFAELEAAKTHITDVV